MEDRSRAMDQSPRGRSGDEPGGIRLFAAGTAVGSRFEIRSVRGTGGSAVVYSAFDRDLKQVVALKVLRADRTSPAALARLRREVAIARQAASPRLVRVYDIDASGESVFLTMEDVEGGSLKERLADGPPPLEDTLRIAGEILEGLAVLHGLGIVHRDVKPGNVLLTADGSVKLADFGLARRFEADETRATSMDAVVGTVEYLSPEQALGKDLDGRSDLYSFGITLWEMLTGGVPFRRDSAVGTALAHVREPAPPLRSARSDAPAWLAAYEARLLAKTPEERYPTAEAALADLRARRATATTAWRGRRRALAAVVVLAGLALAAGLLLGTRFRNSPAPVRFAERADGRGVVALDGNGRALWNRTDLASSGALVSYRRPGGKPGVAAVVSDRLDERTRGVRIVLLEPASGAARGEIHVAPPDGSNLWDFPNAWTYGTVDAADVDGRDGDELVVSLIHPESFPSAVLLVDPETGVSRPLLFASGHQVFMGAVDLDGDGRKELVFGSAANRLGQYAAVASIHPAGHTGPARSASSPNPLAAVSPDLPFFEDRLDSLAWYALGPATRTGAARRMDVDPQARVLRFTGLSAEPFELGFDGFPSGNRSALGSAARQERRTKTWVLLRRAARLAESGDPAAAASTAAEAVATIAPAGDPSVLEWARRSEGRLRIAAGQVDEGEQLFREVARGAVAGVSVALDAARALHLSGELSRAIPWYREAALGRGDQEEPWIVIGAFEDALLAFCEAGRFDEALALVERGPVAWSWKEEMRAVVLWRAGRPLPPSPGIEPSTSLRRLWLLEERLAGGADAAALLAAVVAERARAAGDGELLDLLEAELLLRTGRGRDAWNLAAPAFSALWARRSSDVTARGHLGLAAERAAKAAEAAGARAEAVRIRKDANRFLAAAR